MALLIKVIKYCLLFTVLFLSNMTLQAQELLLDQQVKAGGLKLYPIYSDAKKYYYIPDKVIVPTGADGKKQFSFLKFGDDGFGEIKKGAQGELSLGGGGLVSFLVSFEVDKETVNNAESELQSIIPGAKIVGPATYKEGNFTLVSNFVQENGDWGTHVVGIGKAPVMEGHKAAVSMRLSKKGAIILWESFHQAASDISVSFEMNISGYRNPYESDVVVYWDKVAKNRSINIGSKSTYLGVDIQNIMKSLKDDGAIKVTTKGKDEQGDKMWSMVFGLLVKRMFDKSMDPITLATLQDDQNSFSNFEKANAFNIQERDRVRKDNKEKNRQMLLGNTEEWPLLGDVAKALYGQGEKKHTGQQTKKNGAQALNGSETNSNKKSNSGKLIDHASALASRVAPSPNETKLQTPPSFSLLASYRKKQFKTSGKFELSLRHSTKDTQAVIFDENIGAFGKRMLTDPAHFRVINLDDPAFKNRLISITVDGQDTDDFNHFVNFVSIKIRKIHQDGTRTNRELVITRKEFNANANNFSIIYGYHGDKDGNRWRQYEYQITWNLFGGAVWTSEWTYGDSNYISVVPNHRYKEVTVVADPRILAELGVRLATVKFTYELFGKKFVREVTMKSSLNEKPTKSIKYAYEVDAQGDFDSSYTYEISWLKRGNVRVTQAPKTATEIEIYADEVPRQ